MWYGNSSNQDCKALQRVVRLGSTLPSLQDIYLKRCKSRAAKITKDSNHPGNHLFFLLPCLHILLAHLCLYYYLLSPQYTVLPIVLYLILIFSYYFYFISTYIYIYSLVLCFIFFALSIERTCPDLHFTTDYILYN